MSAPGKSRFSFAAAPARIPPGAAAGARWRYALASAGPLGLSPWAPGTVAALATALVGHWFPPTGAALAAAAIVLFFAGAWAATGAEALLQDHDPRSVVIDEVLGQWLAFALVAPTTWLAAGAGFALFRLFDVWKPFPIDRLERLPAGWGIMADDALAGLYAAIILAALRLWRLV